MNFKPFINITRPGNCFFTLLCVFFGGLYYHSSFLNIQLLFAALSAMLIAAGGYIINDVYDLEIDKINKPGRPLPSGKISTNNAVRLYIILTAIGLLSAVFTFNSLNILIAGINALLLLFYAKTFKTKFLSGNIIVAYSAASTFLFGAIVTNNLRSIIPLLYFSFVYTLIREWVKTIEDMDGDREQKAHTIALKYGSHKTARLTYIPAGFIIIGVYLFYLLDFYNTSVYFALNLLVSVPLIFALVLLNKSQHPKVVQKIHFYMKLDMLVLLLIFLTEYVGMQIYYLSLLRSS